MVISAKQKKYFIICLSVYKKTSYMFLALLIRISEILPWDKNLILLMLSYQGRQVTSSCEIAS